jgi:hypothetical protein
MARNYGINMCLDLTLHLFRSSLHLVQSINLLGTIIIYSLNQQDNVNTTTKAHINLRGKMMLNQLIQSLTGYLFANCLQIELSYRLIIK